MRPAEFWHHTGSVSWAGFWHITGFPPPQPPLGVPRRALILRSGTFHTLRGAHSRDQGARGPGQFELPTSNLGGERLAPAHRRKPACSPPDQRNRALTCPQVAVFTGVGGTSVKVASIWVES